jgi:hypothetical protein
MKLLVCVLIAVELINLAFLCALTLQERRQPANDILEPLVKGLSEQTKYLHERQAILERKKLEAENNLKIAEHNSRSMGNNNSLDTATFDYLAIVKDIRSLEHLWDDALARSTLERLKAFKTKHEDFETVAINRRIEWLESLVDLRGAGSFHEK